MKIYFFLFMLMAVGFISCEQNKSRGFTLTGDIKGLKDSLIYLELPVADSSKADSAIVKNGHFEFRGVLAEPAIHANLATKERYISLYLENADVHITGNMDSIDQLKITGSASQIEYDNLKATYADIHDREMHVYELYDDAFKKKDSASEADLEGKMDELRKQRLEKIYAFVKSHPKSPVSTAQISYLTFDGDYKVLADLFAGLDTTQQNSDGGKTIQKQLAILKKRSVGQPIIDFTQNDVNGKPVVFSQFNKGKYVLLDFWASWCGPCRGENPNVLKAYNRYKAKGLEIMGVSLDENGPSWKKAITDDGMPWTQVSDLKGWKNEVAQQYGIEGIPFNFLVDPNGIIVASNLRGTRLERKLREILK